MHRGERADFHQEFLDWGYRELTLPAAPGGGSLIEWEALHLWPRRESLIVSHANTDGSHTLTLFMPFDGAAASFAGLAGRAAAERYFRHQFGDLAALAPELVDQFLAQPVGSLVSVRTSPWHWRGRAVLVGDACHAVFPFYGQGMNSALEDCLVLHRCLATARSREAALQCYQEERKPHLEALAALTRRNFDELRARVRSPLFVLGKRVDLWLGRLLPGIWQPLYTLVAHTTVPYAEAERRVRRQRRAAALVAGAAAAGLLWWAARRARRGRPRRRPGRDSN
jgi:kynurenine 3-monooxygenase